VTHANSETGSRVRQSRRGSPGLLGLLVCLASTACAEGSLLDEWLIEQLSSTADGRSPPLDTTPPSETPPPDTGGPASCEPDAFEPNDTPESAAIIGAEAVDAVSCSPADLDYYLFTAPPVGSTFWVRVRFENAVGDIDAALFSAADGALVFESATFADDELLAAVSDGGQYLLEVWLFASSELAGVPYSVEIVEAAATGNDCCSENDTPGCNDLAVLECLCAADPYCCASGYDAFCVQLATSDCGGGCGAPANPGSCCSESGAAGCGDAEIESCVCRLAPFCCSGPYDGTCVSIATGLCGASCGEETP